MPDESFFDSDEVFDVTPPAPPAPPQLQSPATETALVPTETVKYDTVVTELKVELPDGRIIPMPIDETAAKLTLQVTTAEVAHLFRKQVAQMQKMRVPLPPKELKELVQAAESLDGLMRAQFLSVENDRLLQGLKPSTPLGKMVQGLVSGVAKATASATTEAVMDRFAKMGQAKKKKDTIVDVTPDAKS